MICALFFFLLYINFGALVLELSSGEDEGGGGAERDREAEEAREGGGRDDDGRYAGGPARL